jgi:predicted DNA-binding transcriptional regulator YafY
MKRSKTQFRRLTELTELIREGKQPVNCLILSKEWEVSQKTVQRDIDFLRDQLHAPLDYDRLRKTYFFTEPTWSMPALVVSEGEILAVLLGSRTLEQYHGTPVAKQLESIFQKLAELLPDKVRIRPEDMFNRFSFRCPPARAVTPENWAAVIRGLCEQKTLKMFYRKAEIAATEPAKEYQFNPYHVANLQGEWYVFGVYDGQADVRQFSMARIERATVTAASFQMPADFDPEKLLADTFGRFSGKHESHTVRLLFSKEAARWVEEREWHPQQLLRRRRTGDIELSFPAKGLYEVQRWILSWGHDVRVLEPKALREAVVAEVRAMAAAVDG